MNKKLVIVPTYNEIENISDLLADILKLDLDILVVDDNSPDNTSEIVKDHEQFNSKVFLLARDKKLGLGSAYRDGFQWGINLEYDFLIEMDADFSHSTQDLKIMLESIEDNSLIIGSRYVNGGKIIGWSKRRHLLSFIANKYSQVLTFSSVNDMTSGFRIYTSETLKKINYYQTSRFFYCCSGSINRRHFTITLSCIYTI